MRRRPAAVLLLLLGFARVRAPEPSGLANPDLEQGELGQVPTGWFFPPVCAQAGYSAKLTADRPKNGQRCAVLARDGEVKQQGFGNLLQDLPLLQPVMGGNLLVDEPVPGFGRQYCVWPVALGSLFPGAGLLVFTAVSSGFLARGFFPFDGAPGWLPGWYGPWWAALLWLLLELRAARRAPRVA